MTRRLRRSELATPGSSQKMIARAAASTADLVFLDLEDAVAPAEKAAARGNVIAALNELDWQGKTRAVRINSADTSWSHEDIIEVVEGAGQKLDIIIVPKVKAPRDVWFVATLLDQLESKLGLVESTGRRIGLELLVEEVEAVARIDEIAACSDRIEALILGVGDLAASQGIRVAHVLDPAIGYPGDLWHYARCRMVIAARSNGLDAIDGPYPDFKDGDGYREEATRASTLGCVGKWAIHPDQIALANEVFSPTDREIAMARKMSRVYHDGVSGGQGSSAAGGVMVDAATARLFDAILERAELCGRL